MNEAIPKQYLAMSRAVAGRVPAVLAGRGLEPAFADWVVTRYHERVWLFGVLDVPRLQRLEQYVAPATLHHLSTALRGLPVYVSNSSGLRYGFLLSRPPRLPRRADFPGARRGYALLGVEATGQSIAVRWSELGHLLVAGMTGFGKSTFLRLLVYQAIGEGFRLLLADLDLATFPMLESCAALLAPIAATPAAVEAIVGRALGECDRRAALFAQVGGFPENLDEHNEQAVKAGREPLPRLLVVLDEFNATVTALGGPRGSFAGEVAQLAWRGRKFGVHLVFAAQDMAKEVVGRVRDQVAAAVCFRVRSPETARAVGCAGAQNLTIPGRAISDRWGPLQAYYLDKSALVGGAPRLPLSEQEEGVLRQALERDGRMSIPLLCEWGMTERQARRLLEEWEQRGWVRKDPQRDNARYVTDDLASLLSNRQTCQTASNLSNRRQTEGRTVETCNLEPET